MKLNIAVLGLIDYKEALELQERLHKLQLEGKTGDCLLLLEHPPVLTSGRRGSKDNILLKPAQLEELGVQVYEINRGGDITYHGPGQIVGYPVINLNNIGRDIKDFVWKLEEVFIRLLETEYGIAAYREEKKYTGVWVGDSKITAIGIAVKQWVTMHGFAFNVNTDLSHFKWINPCGITDRGVTSVQELTGEKQNINYLNMRAAEYFCEIFGYDLNIITRDELDGILKSDTDHSVNYGN